MKQFAPGACARSRCHLTNGLFPFVSTGFATCTETRFHAID